MRTRFVAVSGLIVQLSLFPLAAFAQEVGAPDPQADASSSIAAEESVPLSSVSESPPIADAQDVSPADSTPSPTGVSAQDGVVYETIALPTETPAEAPAAQASASRVLEEIVVTAQKREENLQDVPVSVSAFSGEKLDALGVSDIQDLPQITPGLQVGNLVGYSIIFLRGVGSDIFLPSADSSVATYLDGIYTPFAHSLAQEFGKVERIEVLKGPQGTLYGRNSTGGAINTITASPEREFSGTTAVEFGNFNSRKLKAYLTGPVGDNVQLGFSAFNTHADTYYERPSDSQFGEFAPDRSYGAQLKANWDITDDLSLTLTGLMTRSDGSTAQILSSLEVRPTFALLIPERDEAWVADPDSEPYGRSENDMVYGELRWATPFAFDLKVLASHQNVLTDFNVDFDADRSPLVDFNPKNQGAIYTTGEIQFLSNDETFFSDRLTLIGGYYYFKQEKAGFRNIELGVGEGATDPFIEPTLTAINDLLGALDLPLDVPTDIKVYFNGLAAADADAIFAQGTFNFTDQLALTLGARYQEETKFLTQSQLGIVTGETLSPPFLEYAPRSTDSTQFSPKVTISFTFPDDTLLFATAQKGFKSGTYQIANIASTPEFVEPEEIISYELGIKGLLFDGTLQYSAAVFQNTIEEVQVAVIALQNGGAISFENAPEARIQGVDGDIIWQPLPNLAPGFVLNASGAFLDGEYTDYPDGTGFNDLGLIISDDFTGRDTVRTPEFSYNLGATYSFELGNGVVEAGVSYYYNDGFFFDAQNDAVQPSYSLLNARLSYLHEPTNLRLTLFGANLEDSEYFLVRFPVDFNISGTYGSPATYGARLEYSF